MRPNAIKWFERFYFASVAASVLAIMLSYGTLRAQAIARGESPAGSILGVIIAITTGWLFWFFIARRASNVAKWILVVLTVAGTLLVPSTWNQVAAVGTGYFLLSGASHLLSFVSIVFLFQPDAVAWLRSKGQVPPIDPDVFA